MNTDDYRPDDPTDQNDVTPNSGAPFDDEPTVTGPAAQDSDPDPAAQPDEAPTPEPEPPPDESPAFELSPGEDAAVFDEPEPEQPEQPEPEAAAFDGLEPEADDDDNVPTHVLDEQAAAPDEADITPPEDAAVVVEAAPGPALEAPDAEAPTHVFDQTPPQPDGPGDALTEAETFRDIPREDLAAPALPLPDVIEPPPPPDATQPPTAPSPTRPKEEVSPPLPQGYPPPPPGWQGPPPPPAGLARRDRPAPQAPPRRRPAPAQAPPGPVGRETIGDRVWRYEHAGYTIRERGPHGVVLDIGRSLSVLGWLVAFVSFLGLLWYLFIQIGSGFHKDWVSIRLGPGGHIAEDGPGAAHVRRRRSRSGRRWGLIGAFFLIFCLILGLILAVVGGLLLSNDEYQAALREAYPEVDLLQDQLNEGPADPDDVDLMETAGVVFGLLGGITLIGLWAGATLAIVGYIHANTYHVPVPPLPGYR